MSIEPETIQEIAYRLGMPPHRVAYAIRSRGIEPSRAVGHTNVFDPAAVARIEQALMTAGNLRAPHMSDMETR